MDTAAPPVLPDLVDYMARSGARPHPPGATRHPDFVALGPRFDRALLYTSAAHREQARKGIPAPYLSHLLGVASIVLTYGGTEDQAIAALLHDTVEDCGDEHVPVIAGLFGEPVLTIVLACTDARAPAGAPKADWWSRKAAYLRHLDGLDGADPALLVSCADKIHNAEAIRADFEAEGPGFWARFPGKAPEDHLWYYARLVSAFTRSDLPRPLVQRLRSAVDGIAAHHRHLSGG